MIKGVLVTKLNMVDAPGGGVMHAMKETDTGYLGFGEAYFSNINYNSMKGWKRHREMTLNLIVPFGTIKFILFDDRDEEVKFQEITLSRSNYSRLTIPPMIWMCFQGLSEAGSMLLNIANIEHNPHEVDRKELNEIQYKWRES